MWNAIYKKLWIVILAPLLAGGVAYFITSQSGGKFKSVAVIEASIPDPTIDPQAKEIPEPDRYYQNMVATMKTEVITSMASYRLLLHDLEKDIAFRPPAIQYSAPKKDQIRSKLEKKLSSFELLSETDATEQTIYKVMTATDYNLGAWIRSKRMTIERRPGTNEIEVTSYTEDPFLSAFAANALSQEFIRYETAITSPPEITNPSNDSIAWYRDEVERLRKDAEQKNSDLKEAGNRSQSPVDDVRFGRAKANRIAEYEMKIVEEEWEVNSLRDQLGQMQRPEPVETARPKTDVASNSKIQTIKKKIDQLSRIYADGGAKDKQLDSIITRLRQQVNEETSRLQAASQKPATVNTDPNFARNRDMLQTRIRRHDDNIAALRNDIKKLKNTTRATATNAVDISKLRREQEEATRAYNLALAALQKAESKQSPQAASSARTGHYLILKEKALPSAEPESPWAMTIILSAVIGTLVVTLIIIIATRPAPPPIDDIFLRVNYANQRRMTDKKKHPHEGDVSLSNR
jgi:uncharacterized protein involved in exopolysaccharide biosynthesis